MSYSIEKSDLGIVIRGPLPVAEFAALSKVWAAEGFDLLHAGIAKAVGATMVVTRKDKIEGWLAEAERLAREQARGDRELEWLHGPHTGLSSLTIFSVLSRENRGAALARLGRFGPAAPLDPDDFMRCRLLLQAIPAWRARLGEVAAALPESTWPELVQHWAELDELFAAEEPSGRCPKTFRLMEKLQQAARERLAAGRKSA